MAMYSGFNKALGRVVMRNITEEQKKRMELNPSYKSLRFDHVPAPVLEPVAVEKRVKAEPEPTKQEGAPAQPKGKTGE
jgi:hypothetical protein